VAKGGPERGVGGSERGDGDAERDDGDLELGAEGVVPILGRGVKDSYRYLIF
jgi:hypothetical protein